MLINDYNTIFIIQRLKRLIDIECAREQHISLLCSTGVAEVSTVDFEQLFDLKESTAQQANVCSEL